MYSVLFPKISYLLFAIKQRLKMHSYLLWYLFMDHKQELKGDEEGHKRV